MDIDDVRKSIFGLPYPCPEESDEMDSRDRLQMKGAYDILLQAADIHLTHGWSIVISATFSSKRWGQDRISAIAGKHPTARLRVLHCRVANNIETEIKLRLSRRQFGVNYFGAANSWERWQALENRYEAIELPHFTIDTSKSGVMPQNITEVMQYIANPLPVTR